MKTIKPSNNNGSIRIRWTVEGTRYSLSKLGAWDSHQDQARANATATQIALDISLGTFDKSLDKYKFPSVAKQTQPKEPSLPLIRELSTLEAWDIWAGQSEDSVSTRHTHHKYIRKAIEVGVLSSSELSTTIYNRRLRGIKQAIRWCREEGYVVNDDKGWLRLKPVKTITEPIRPFNHRDYLKLINAIAIIRPHYLRFTKFLIISGCRIGEVMGLQIESVNVETNEVTIKTTRSREDGGTKPVLKDRTKTEVVRVLKSKQLTDLCAEEIGARTLVQGARTIQGYVFRSVRGKPVDYNYFRKEVWKPALEMAGLEYRKIHTTRHTNLSTALEKGLSPNQVCDISGHKNPATLMKTYAHLINKAEVPKLDI